MEADKLDILLDNFLSGLKEDPKEEWIRSNAFELYNEGIGKEGLLRTIKEELWEHLFKKAETALNKTESDIFVESIEKSGIGGWLAILCIILMLVTPMRSFYELYTVHIVVSPLFENYPGIRNYALLSYLLTIVMALCSIFCGYILWKIKSNAVKYTKIFLIALLISSLIQPFYVYLFELPIEIIDATFEGVPYLYLNAFVFVGIWYSYLSVSDRVKVTYGNNS